MNEFSRIFFIHLMFAGIFIAGENLLKIYEVKEIYFDWKITLILDMGLKLKIVPDSWEYTGFWKFGPYWPQK